MITLEQADVIRSVLKRFNEFEKLEWTALDDNMEFLTWLSDEQLVKEVNIMLIKHDVENARCNKNHPKEECFVPFVIQSIGYIVEDFKESKRLVGKTRYMLEFYLSLTHTSVIISD